MCAPMLPEQTHVTLTGNICGVATAADQGRAVLPEVASTVRTDQEIDGFGQQENFTSLCIVMRCPRSADCSVS